MEMANGDYVLDDRSSSGIAGSYAAAHDEAQAFCQRKALWPAAFTSLGRHDHELFYFQHLSTIRQ